MPKAMPKAIRARKNCATSFYPDETNPLNPKWSPKKQQTVKRSAKRVLKFNPARPVSPAYEPETPQFIPGSANIASVADYYDAVQANLSKQPEKDFEPLIEELSGSASGSDSCDELAQMDKIPTSGWDFVTDLLKVAVGEADVDILP